MKQESLDVIKRVHEIFKERNLTLSAAESCTGGLISHYITALPGASDFFMAAIASYSAETKKNLLGITPETISKHGVVSGETAREMAEKVRLLAKTACSVSSTGNLGPDVLEGKEKGLVYIAAANKEKTVIEKLQLHGNRDANKEEAAIKALELLIKLVEE
jgi:PncC family amidohydrolase